MTEGRSVAADFAVECIEQADHAVRGAAPDPELLLRKAQVYATLAVVEALEGAEGPVFTRD